MSQFGAFSPFGILDFGGALSKSEMSYLAMRDAMKSFDLTEGTHLESSLYAKSIAFGAARAVLRHAIGQRNPAKAVEMLPALERTYQASPLPTDSDDQRRRNVSAAMALQKGSRPEAIETALTNLLGSDLISVRELLVGEQTITPTSPGSVGAFGDPNALHVPFRIDSPITVTGSPLTFKYSDLSGGAGALFAGQAVCFQAENSGLSENVTISGTSVAEDGSLYATATFTKSHDVGGTIMSYAPVLTSTMRRLIVVVTSAVARDYAKRERINRLMQRALRSTTTFAVYEVASGGTGPWIVGVGVVGVTILGPSPNTTAGPFIIGQSLIGITPIGVGAFNI